MKTEATVDIPYLKGKIRFVWENDIVTAYDRTSPDCKVTEMACNRTYKIVNLMSKDKAGYWNRKPRKGGYVPVEDRSKYVRKDIWRAIRPAYSEYMTSLPPAKRAMMARLHGLLGGEVSRDDMGKIGMVAGTEFGRAVMDHRAAAYLMAYLSNMSYVDMNSYRQWADLYSPVHKVEKFRYLSLLHMPGRMPLAVAPTTLASCPALPRQLHNRAEYAFLFSSLGYRLDSEEEGAWDVLRRSTPADFINAIRLTISSVRVGLKMARWNDLITASTYINDYPGTRSFLGIMGLAQRSIEWHNAGRATRPRRVPLGIDESAPYRPYPGSMPEGFTQLLSYGELVAEGDKMDHCIGDSSFYHDNAERGLSYHFHVLRGDSEATCTLTPHGVQAYGSKNTKNSATEWAYTCLPSMQAHMSSLWPMTDTGHLSWGLGPWTLGTL